MCFLVYPGSRVVSRVLPYFSPSRLGGWIQTAYHPHASLRSERGPRALSTHGGLPGPRGDAAQALGLLNELGLAQKVVTADPAAAHRFIYEPKRPPLESAELTTKQLVRRSLVEVTPLRLASRYGATFAGEPFKPALSSSLSAMSSSDGALPSSDGATTGATPLTEHGVPDETLAEFVSRRFSPRIAAELADPGLAGVYAGRADRYVSYPLYHHHVSCPHHCYSCEPALSN